MADRPRGPDAAPTPRAYDQKVDYVLHVKDQVLTPAQVTAKVAAYRAAGTTFEDTVPGTSDPVPRWAGAGRAPAPRAELPANFGG